MKRLIQLWIIRHKRIECANGLAATLAEIHAIDKRRLELESHGMALNLRAARLSAQELNLTLPGRYAV